MGAINFDIAANLLDEPEDEFHPKPFALGSLETGRQPWPVVKYRQRISGIALFKTNGAHERETLSRMAAQWDRLAEHKSRKESEQA